MGSAVVKNDGQQCTGERGGQDSPGREGKKGWKCVGGGRTGQGEASRQKSKPGQVLRNEKEAGGGTAHGQVRMVGPVVTPWDPGEGGQHRWAEVMGIAERRQLPPRGGSWEAGPYSQEARGGC